MNNERREGLCHPGRTRETEREGENDRIPATIWPEHPNLQIVGQNAAWLEELRKLARFARSDAAILIRGETGTGKEICARAVHQWSDRADGPFVPINCGAVPGDLAENELFGHETGAFTGAREAQEGLIGAADGGTLFLDEIDALPPSVQVKLLRFLQDKEYRRLGSPRVVRANVRIVAAAHPTMQKSIAEGRFRSDLFYRLGVLEITLPPLRERKDDLLPLVRHFLARFGAESGRPVTELTADALARLTTHDWPGNIRELENVIQRAVLLTDNHRITVGAIDLPGLESAERCEGEVVTFRERKAAVIAEFERSCLRELLGRTGGNISAAARLAGRSSTLCPCPERQIRGP